MTFSEKYIFLNDNNTDLFVKWLLLIWCIFSKSLLIIQIEKINYMLELYAARCRGMAELQGKKQ